MKFTKKQRAAIYLKAAMREERISGNSPVYLGLRCNLFIVTKLCIEKHYPELHLFNQTINERIEPAKLKQLRILALLFAHQIAKSN